MTASATVGGVTKNSTAMVLVVRPITITAPTATPVRRVGDTLTVTWTKPATVTTGGLLVGLSTDGGQSFVDISGATVAGVPIADGLIKDNTSFYTGTTGTFKWIIPATIGDAAISTISNNCKIRVLDFYATIAHLKVQDQSATFAISARTAAIAPLSESISPLLLSSIHRDGLHLVVNASERYVVSIFSISGAMLLRKEGCGRGDYRVPQIHRSGVYLMRADVDGTKIVRTLILKGE